MSDFALTSSENEELVQQVLPTSVEHNRECTTSPNPAVPQKIKPKMYRRLSSASHVPVSNVPEALTTQQCAELNVLLEKFPEPPTIIISEPSAPVFSLTAIKAASSGWMRGIFGSPSTAASTTPPAGSSSASEASSTLRR